MFLSLLLIINDLYRIVTKKNLFTDSIVEGMNNYYRTEMIVEILLTPLYVPYLANLLLEVL